MTVINPESTTMVRSKNKTVVQPSVDARCCPNFAVIIARRDWTEQNAPILDTRHTEARRNELFLMNVTPNEFQYLRTVKMQDFKAIRLGNWAFDSTGNIVENFKPMFGALKRGARLRRKENKKGKK